MLNRPTFAALTTAALLAVFLLFGCKAPEAGCTEACSHQDDVLTLSVSYLTPEPGVPNPIGEVSYTYAGANHQVPDQPLGNPKIWHAWFHGYSKDGYPAVSITADSSARVATTCSILWLDPETKQLKQLAFKSAPALHSVPVTCRYEGGKPA